MIKCIFVFLLSLPLYKPKNNIMEQQYKLDINGTHVQFIYSEKDKEIGIIEVFNGKYHELPNQVYINKDSSGNWCFYKKDHFVGECIPIIDKHQKLLNRIFRELPQDSIYKKQ